MYYSFILTIFFAGVAQYVSGVGLLFAILASPALFYPELRRVFAQTGSYTKIYAISVGVFVGFIIVSALFGRVGVDGLGLAIELIITLMIGLSLIGYTRSSGKSFLQMLVVLSFFHAGLLIIVALIQTWTHNGFAGYRVNGDLNPIIFAQILMTSAGIAAVWLYQRARKTREWADFIILFIWLLLSIYAVHLTGSKGPILAFYPLLSGFMILCRKDDRTVIIRCIPLLIVAMVMLSVLLFGSDRMILAGAEFGESLTGIENNGSIGLRIQFWKHAVIMIKEHPILGHGMRYFFDIADLPADHPMMAHKHVHNQFLDLWVKSGIAGIVFFAMLYTVPLLAGWKLVAAKVDATLGLMLIWLTGSFFVFGLMDVIITNTGIVTIYATYLVCFLLLADAKLLSTSNKP